MLILFPLGSQATKIRSRCRAHRPSTSIATRFCESYLYYRRLSPPSKSTTNYGSLSDLRRQGEDRGREGLGAQDPEAHLLRFDIPWFRTVALHWF